MQVLLLPNNIVSSLRSVLHEGLLTDVGTNTVNDLTSLLLDIPYLEEYTMGKHEQVRDLIHGNILDTLVSVVLDRIISDYNTLGAQKLMESVMSNYIKFEYKCRYYHVEMLTNEVIASALEKDMVHYDIYRSLTTFIEWSLRDKDLYEKFCVAVLMTLQNLLDFSEVDLHNVTNTSIVDGTLLLFSRDNEDGCDN